jgi:hypothetical protein
LSLDIEKKLVATLASRFSSDETYACIDTGLQSFHFANDALGEAYDFICSAISGTGELDTVLLSERFPEFHKWRAASKFLSVEETTTAARLLVSGYRRRVSMDLLAIGKAKVASGEASIEDIAREIETLLAETEVAEEPNWALRNIREAAGERSNPPSMGLRDDNKSIVYAGRLTAVNGEPGHGKGMFVCGVAIDELQKGNNVGYFDFETSSSDIRERMVENYYWNDSMFDLFGHRTIEKDYSSRDRNWINSWFEERNPSLVIIDGLTVALSLAKINPNSDTEVSEYIRKVLYSFRRPGTAVLVVDHVSKAGRKDTYASGSKAKKALVDVAIHIEADPKTPIGRKTQGFSRIRLTKDRYGHLVPYQDENNNIGIFNVRADEHGRWQHYLSA